MRTALLLLLLVMFGSPAAAQHPLSAAEESGLRPGQTFRECALCPEMVLLPGGDFAMGSPAEERARDDNEGPQHAVRIRAFALGRFEITVAEFTAFVQATGHDAGAECDIWREGVWAPRPGFSWRNPGFAQTDAHPATCLSWDDAQAYLAWLSRRTGKTYRLPSEAEWEYAARAGSVSRFSFGDDEAEYCRHGNGADASAARAVPGAQSWTVLPCDDRHPYAAPVGRFAANAFGLFDALGNVFEWVEDCWNDSYAGAPADGTAWRAGDCAIRVQRGGAWGYPPDYLRVATRGRQPQRYRYVNAGFRAARSLGP